MAPVKIGIGDKLDLVSMKMSAQLSDTKVYKSKILDKIDGQRFQVSMPMEGYKVLLLPVGGRYEATIYSGKNIYVCQVSIAERYKVGNQYVMDITMISTPKKFQRRAYFRLEYTRDFEFHLSEEEAIHGDEAEDMEETRVFFDRGILLDLSGGGCKFVSREEIEPGERLILRIPLEGKEKKILTVTGTTLSSKRLENHSRSYEHRVEFVDIENAQREEIIQFIFQQERKNRKRRKS